jgi:hypothetical protein
VLLPLGRKQHFCVQGHLLCLHYALCLMQLSSCSQLNTQGVLGRFPASGFLVIDAVGWRSMYLVVMPRVSLIVFIVMYVRYLYSINCPTVIYLPSMLLFILWRDATSELWTLVQFPLYCFTILLYSLCLLFLHYYYPFTTRYAQSFVYSKPVRLTTSS